VRELGGVRLDVGRAGIEDVPDDAAGLIGVGCAADDRAFARATDRPGREHSIWTAAVPATTQPSQFPGISLNRPPTTTIDPPARGVRVSCWRRIVTGQTVLTIPGS
jgi:hypothetical protein